MLFRSNTLTHTHCTFSEATHGPGDEFYDLYCIFTPLRPIKPIISPADDSILWDYIELNARIAVIITQFPLSGAAAFVREF